MFYRFISKVAQLIPQPIIRRCHLYKLAGLFLNKEEEGLVFWELFAKKFEQDKHKLLEYWENYRYLADIEAICKINDDSRVLDVGCGVCTVLHCLRGDRTGIDPLADELLKIYTYPENIKIQKGFGENIPFQDMSFDVVFCSNALDHTDNPQQAFNEIHRVLKPHGYFVLTVELIEENKNRDPAHPHSLGRNDVHSLLKGKFQVRFEKESPWIGLRAYFEGSRKSHNKELIMILQKV